MGARPAPRLLEREEPAVAGAEVRAPPGGRSPRPRRAFGVTWPGDPGVGRLFPGLPLTQDRRSISLSGWGPGSLEMCTIGWDQDLKS